MELPEPPECPVCLGQYDTVSAIPRVLSCGHSTCEACISQLPNPFPSTIRCPCCTQLVKLPSCPSFLPKNIDLLRLSSLLQSHTEGFQKVIPGSPLPSTESKVSHVPLMPNLWSHDFYLKWRNWVIKKGSITIDVNSKSDEIFPSCSGKVSGILVNSYCRCTFEENEKVGLVKVGAFRNFSGKQEEKVGSLCHDLSKFKFSYEAKVLKVLSLMKESEINEVSLVLNASSRINRVGKIYGFWCDEEDDSVYIVTKEFSDSLVKCIQELKNGFLGIFEGPDVKISEMVEFGMLAMEICEVVNDLHVEGVLVGCMGLSCFSFNYFARVFVDFGELLRVCRRLCLMLNRIEDMETMISETMELRNYVFVSPEVLLELSTKKGVELGVGILKYEVGYASDIWSLACVLISLLLGNLFADEIHSYYGSHFTAMVAQKNFDYVHFYSCWMERIVALLEGRLDSKFLSLKQILCKCLSFDPGKRPSVTDLWKCIRELIVKSEIHSVFHSELDLVRQNSYCCIVLGNLCHSVIQIEKGRTGKISDALLERDENGGKSVDKIEGSMVDRGVVEGLADGRIKCIYLKGHFDSITGLAIGGFFSCPFI